MLPVANRILEGVAAEIRALDSEAKALTAGALERRIQIGRLLIEAKKRLPYGEFLPWVQREFGWSRMHVSRHMGLASNATRVLHLPPEASFREALTYPPPFVFFVYPPVAVADSADTLPISSVSN